MEGGGQGKEFWWAADLLKDLEEPTTTDQVKGFSQVHKSKEQWLLLLTTLLLQLAEGEDHIYCGPAGSEATLGLWINSQSKTLQAAQCDMCKDFAYNAEEWNAAIVITIASVTLVFVKGDYTSISCLVGYILSPSSGREAREVAGGWKVCHALGLLLVCCPTLAPCHRQGCRWHGWKSEQGIKGSDCHDVLGRVELEIVLNPMLQLLPLVGYAFARLHFEQCCFDACGAGGRLYPLVHHFGIATVGGCLDLGAQVLPVHVSTAAGGLLSFAHSYSEGAVCAMARVLLICQRGYPFIFPDWLHFIPMRLEPVSIFAFFSP